MSDCLKPLTDGEGSHKAETNVLEATLERRDSNLHMMSSHNLFSFHPILQLQTSTFSLDLASIMTGQCKHSL